MNRAVLLVSVCFFFFFPMARTRYQQTTPTLAKVDLRRSGSWPKRIKARIHTQPPWPMDPADSFCVSWALQCRGPGLLEAQEPVAHGDLRVLLQPLPAQVRQARESGSPKDESRSGSLSKSPRKIGEVRGNGEDAPSKPRWERLYDHMPPKERHHKP